MLQGEQVTINKYSTKTVTEILTIDSKKLPINSEQINIALEQNTKQNKRNAGIKK